MPRRRYRKPRKCHGCKEADVWDDDLCQDCRSLLDLGKDHLRWIERSNYGGRVIIEKDEGTGMVRVYLDRGVK